MEPAGSSATFLCWWRFAFIEAKPLPIVATASQKMPIGLLIIWLCDKAGGPVGVQRSNCMTTFKQLRLWRNWLFQFFNVPFCVTGSPTNAPSMKNEQLKHVYSVWLWACCCAHTGHSDFAPLSKVWAGALLMHCYLEEAESDCAIDQQILVQRQWRNVSLLF